MRKFAAYIGNKHTRIRVSAFFDAYADAVIAGNATTHQNTFVLPCFNWMEHIEWNRQRVGLYADMPVAESI